MAKITFITGGVASGKSNFACKLAEKYNKVSFIATAEALDQEMAQKIEKHRLSRPKSWQIIESGRVKLENVLDKKIKGDACIIDCMTMYVSNMLADTKEEEIMKSIRILLKKMRQNKTTKEFIIVSNEVGMGIVPTNKLARKFREVLRNTNKIIASAADKVYLQISGITIKLKGGHCHTGLTKI